MTREELEAALAAERERADSEKKAWQEWAHKIIDERDALSRAIKSLEKADYQTFRELTQRAEEAQKNAQFWREESAVRYDETLQLQRQLEEAQKEVERLRTSNTALLTANAIIQQDGIARNDRLVTAEKELANLARIRDLYYDDARQRERERDAAEARAARMREVVEAANLTRGHIPCEGEGKVCMVTLLWKKLDALAALEGK